jgi:G3E family GTPase
MRSDRLPVTVIYGLPGSGKTTVVSYLCDRRKEQRIALSPLYGGEAAFGHIHQLALADGVDYLLIEAGGSCQPESLATRLTQKNGAGAGLAEILRLDTMVAVVDVSSLTENFCSWNLLSDRGLVAHLGDDRALVEALTVPCAVAHGVVEVWPLKEPP